MPLSLKQAAEETGKSKPTILRAIQTGKISAEKDPHGEWQIEPAELFRVYERVSERTVSEEALRNDTHHSENAYETGMLVGEVEQLRERLRAMQMDRERERQEAADQIADLRRRLDQADQERREAQTRVTALLTDQTKKVEQTATPDQQPREERNTRPGLLARLFRKAS